jgi:Uma2 family endonuclease
MATTTPPTTIRVQTMLPTHWTLADLQQHLGGVPLERIRLYPPPGMATVEDALAIDNREDRLCELVDGVLVEKVMSTYESVLAGFLIQRINTFLESRRLGVVTTGDGALWILPRKMRIPDVSFIRWERFPNRKLPKERVYRVAPDLAVEILSEGNTEDEMQQKLAEYFEAGVQLVWYIDPSRRIADVYTTPDQMQALGEQDMLDGQDVLPGFQLRLGELFERAEDTGE